MLAFCLQQPYRTYASREVAGYLRAAILFTSRLRSLFGSLEKTMVKIRILIADTQSLFRQTVRELLHRESDFEVVGEAATEREAVTQAHRARPDVALVGSELTETYGVKAIRMIKQGVPACRIVAVANGEDPEMLYRIIEAGANGYITMECALSELMLATRAVHRRETLVPPRMLGDLLDRLLQARREEFEAMKRISRLTHREMEVLALLAEGGDKETIARILVISPGTARTHIQHILTKLGVHSRLEAAAIGRQGGILDEVQLPLHEVPAAAR